MHQQSYCCEQNGHNKTHSVHLVCQQILVEVFAHFDPGEVITRPTDSTLCFFASIGSIEPNKPCARTQWCRCTNRAESKARKCLDPYKCDTLGCGLFGHPLLVSIAGQCFNVWFGCESSTIIQN